MSNSLEKRGQIILGCCQKIPLFDTQREAERFGDVRVRGANDLEQPHRPPYAPEMNVEALFHEQLFAAAGLQSHPCECVSMAPL